MNASRFKSTLLSSPSSSLSSLSIKPTYFHNYSMDRFTTLANLGTVRDGNMADVCGVLNTNLHDMDDSYGYVLRDPDTGCETVVFVSKEYAIPLVAAGDAVLLYNVLVTHGQIHYCKLTKTVSMSTDAEVRCARYDELAKLNEVEFLESMMSAEEGGVDSASTSSSHAANTGADSTIKDILRLLKVESKPPPLVKFNDKRHLNYIPIIHLVNGVFDAGSQYRIYGQIVAVCDPRFYVAQYDGLKHAKCKLQIGDANGAILTVVFKDGQETQLTGVDVAHSTNRKDRMVEVLQSLKGQFVHVGVELRRSKVLGFGVKFVGGRLADLK